MSKLFCATAVAALMLPSNVLLAEGFGTARTAATAAASPKEAVANTTPSFDILSCPFGVFREAYLGAFTAADRLGIMALEDEAIAACAKRQERVNLILNQERELRALLTASQDEDALDAAQRQRANTTSQDTGTPPPATTVAGKGGSDDAAEQATELATEQATVLAKAQATPQPVTPTMEQLEVVSGTDVCAREYVVEITGHQYGGDGQYHWATLRSGLGEEYVVKAGDSLPGNWRISSVSTEVVLAVDPQGQTIPLPVAPTEPGSAIDVNFKYTIQPNTALTTQMGVEPETLIDEGDE